jgi:hypothetical protein
VELNLIIYDLNNIGRYDVVCNYCSWLSPVSLPIYHTLSISYSYHMNHDRQQLEELLQHGACT